MACSSCSSAGGCGTNGGGCSSGSCGTGSCNKMNTFDWLGNLDLSPAERYPFVEIRFKGGRKEFFKNPNAYPLITGDAVVVDTGGGFHVGFVSLQGELVRLQMLKKKVKEADPEIRDIIRMATQKDLDKLAEMRNKEMGCLFRCRQIIDEHSLKMKLSDVEYQADGTKVSFFYSADDRVDFRDLIKALASEFKVRIEMRQISLRQEAGRLGGIGSCGRELCCSTWLSDFKSVTTSAARYQNLSLNPAKLSGQCGRLKCCLNYELETYVHALKDIPNVDKHLLTQKGDGIHQKTDIFRKIMWFGYKDDNNWRALSVERVRTILALNAKGEKPLALTEEEEITLLEAENPQPINQDLKQLDKKMLDRDKALKRQKQQDKQKFKKDGKSYPTDEFASSSYSEKPTFGSSAAKQSQPQNPQQGKAKFESTQNQFKERAERQPAVNNNLAEERAKLLAERAAKLAQMQQADGKTNPTIVNAHISSPAFPKEKGEPREQDARAQDFKKKKRRPQKSDYDNNPPAKATDEQIRQTPSDGRVPRKNI